MRRYSLDLAALIGILIMLACTWRVLDRQHLRDREFRGREIRRFRGRELPSWWPLPWPEVTQIETWSTPDVSGPRDDYRPRD